MYALSLMFLRSGLFCQNPCMENAECIFHDRVLTFRLNIPGSMLHAMFSGRFETKPSEDGSYFIDRDGTHFRYILNYLRTGQLLVPEDKFVRRELLAEAEFYQVEGIINDLRAGSFKNSLILSSDQCQTLMNWLNDTLPLTSSNLVPYLVYRTSRYGSNYHIYSDNKGPTVTVVKSGDYIFGGYTDQSWDGRLSIKSTGLTYRIYSNKRRGAYLIFRALSAALIENLEAKKNLTFYSN